ncbi:alpha/beta hydrolase [Sandaracinobacter neustonicus]|uniref:Alpha/beta hydrolase n=1 Tax=Sandaracinobacter neustonicus TaxID=1715348 RepID=A0A501XLR3_9SPHN|nr:alpha/beta hydrolase [Sandaracinobacter neustonicus]TPE61214.1 alpha/beta hydrolase [Sandaracinobacter neustonicus]
MSDQPALTPHETILTGPSGLRLFTRSWKPPHPPRAIVAICHGVNSHSGQYLWAGAELAKAGFAVHALDLRGRGKSDGERFYVDSIDEYVADLSTLIAHAKAENPGLPLYLLGHSAGGVVSCTYTLDHQAELAGLICESFAFRVFAPDLALTLMKGLSHVIPHTGVLKLKFDDFSRDPAAVAAMYADPLIEGEAQPVATVAALTRADERLERDFPKITLPVFILHGTADHTTRPEGSQLFFEKAGSTDKTLKLYEGHFHDLLNDLGKEQVVADIIGWINTRHAGR